MTRYGYYRLTAGLILSVCGLVLAKAKAHPLADVRFDRTIAVRLSRAGVEVVYTLDVSLLGMHLDAASRLTPVEVARMERTLRGYATAYARKAATEVTTQLQLSIDSQLVPWQLRHWEVTLTDHPSCRYWLYAAWPAGGRERVVQIVDRTFGDYPGVVQLTVDTREVSAGVEILDVEEPPARLRVRPIEQLTEPEAIQARRARVEVRLPAPSDVTDTLIPKPIPTENSSPSEFNSLASEAPSDESPKSPSDWWAELYDRGLLALFDSSWGWGLLLLVAFAFGAAHAFTPGHGKTLVAAYLIGERGTVRHAILLALTTTFAHTGSVLIVSITLWLIYGTHIPVVAHGLLQLLAGVLIVGVGIWLLSRRLAGRADHFHLFSDHHHHGHNHPHSLHHHHPPERSIKLPTHNFASSSAAAFGQASVAEKMGVHEGSLTPSRVSAPVEQIDPAKPANDSSTVGWLRLVLMGLGGGLVPCWDAVLLLVAASAVGRLDAAIPLLIAFSTGLGSVLVALGIGVVYAFRAGHRQFQDAPWFRQLPMFSAAALVGLGLWLCQNALALLGGRSG
ncbi:MAG: hypothetical protein NZU63_02430 [Gemmataceae bacterium]|nr:hypothetical protein [Gemmataceae bacterium]